MCNELKPFTNCTCGLIRELPINNLLDIRDVAGWVQRSEIHHLSTHLNGCVIHDCRFWRWSRLGWGTKPSIFKPFSWVSFLNPAYKLRSDRRSWITHSEWLSCYNIPKSVFNL